MDAELADSTGRAGARQHAVAWASRLESALGRIDLGVLVGLVALAGLVRFVGLAARGTWDADQGHDMLVLRAFVHDGIVPLLGPPTSIGDVHHGAWYYYLLAPAAWLSAAAPEAVVGAIALGGVAATGVTWWIARSLGGPIAGLAAGLVMAVSASAIEESTFIWNPNIIALSSAVAVAGAVRAWSTRRARWWLVAGVGVALTMQAHVLGAVVLPPFAALLLADAWRRGPGGERRDVLAAGLGCLAILAIAFLPLALHELTADFSETRAALDFIAAGGEPATLSLPARLLFVALRVVAWPLTGLVTDALGAAVLAAALVVAFVIWRSVAGRGPERALAAWFAGTLAWSAVALAFAAGGLSTVVAGLPNDHYHAFLDPIVFVVVGLGVAGLWRLPAGVGGPGPTRPAAGPVAGPAALAAMVVAVLVAFNVAIWPPAIAADGGWPAARDAGVRIARVVAGRSVGLLGLPAFKPADAIGFPLVHAGVPVVDTGEAGALVVVCDALFEAAIGAPCGGPAEEAAVGRPDRFVALADRFSVSSRTTVSVYLPRR